MKTKDSMENTKPTYHELEQELEEYKTLLWQLSDEYKLNVGNAEKEVKKLEDKCTELENKLSQNSEIKQLEKNEESASCNSDLSVISNLGIASCMISKDGKIIEINNKFKFFVELLSFDADNLTNIEQLFSKANNKNLVNEYELFKNSDDLVFQSLLTARNSFNSMVNMVIKISPYNEGKDYLALFIEVKELKQKDTETTDNKHIKQTNTDKEICDNNIEIFAEKYDVYRKLLKVFGSKKRKKPEVLPENMYVGFVRAFNLEQERQAILSNLDETYHEFTQNIKKQYLRLTNNEVKHCMLIKAGLNYKEIASLMDISVNGVKIARNRLRKKLRIDDSTTSDFINSI